MKKLFALAFVALSLMTSCSSDESVSVTEEKLVKKWYYKSFQANGETDAYGHQACSKDYIQFLADGTYIEHYVNTCSPLDTETFTGSWVLEGNTVAVSIDGDNFSGKVTKISATELQITQNGDYDEDGDDEKIKANFTNN